MNGKRSRSIYFIGFLSFLTVLLTSCGVLKGGRDNKGSISPNEYGLHEARTDIERYYVLEKTHQIANQLGLSVSYKGIGQIDIEIPADAKGIKLGNNTDFSGVVFNVRNKTKDIRLFSASSSRNSLEVPKKSIDEGDFSKIEALARGCHILIIEDENPWGDNRTGYEYAHKRKDVLLVKNGKAVNKPVMPYNNANSAPKCYYAEVTGEPFRFKNITVNRTNDCTYKTYILYVDGYNDVQIENVTVNTPESKLTGDHVIRIHNSTNVSITNTNINGTYSSEDHSGYGISMNNVWNFYASNLYGRGKWGLFGCNNINTSTLEKCDINRFDIHCYGKNCSFKKVNFEEIGNQFSSVYGTIEFDECIFTNCDPIINRSSYNAFVGYELFFNDCIFNVTPKKKYLINMGDLSGQLNTRPELREKCWPNIHIKNLTVNMTEGVRELVLLTSRGPVDYQKPIGYMEIIEIDGMTVNCENGSPLKSIVIGTKNVGTENKIDCVLKDVIIKELGTMTKGMAFQTIEPILSVKIPLKRNRVQFKNVVGTKK